MPSARDRLLKGKKAPAKEISNDEAIENGRMIINDFQSNPEFKAPKAEFELSGDPASEEQFDEDVDNLMNMSPTAQKVFNSKMASAKEEAEKLESMFSKVQEEEELIKEDTDITEESLEAKNPMNKAKAALLGKMSGLSNNSMFKREEPKEEIKAPKEEPKEEIKEIEKDVELKSFNNIPDFKLDNISFNDKEEETEEIEESKEEIKEEPKEEEKFPTNQTGDEVTFDEKEEIKEEKVEKPIKEEKKEDILKDKPVKEKSSMNETMMERMIKGFAKALIKKCKAEGISVHEFEPEEMEVVYEYILEKLK